MPTVGIFRRCGDVPPMDWFAQGCFVRGYLPTLLEHSDFDMRPFDVVAVGGNLGRYHGRNGQIFIHYRTKGLPVFCVETGRLIDRSMVDRHWYLYLNRVPMIPKLSDDMTHDRRIRLGMVCNFKPRGDHIVIIGQQPDEDSNINRNCLDTLRRATDRPIVYRPRKCHGEFIKDVEVSTINKPEEELDRAWAVVTSWSNMGAEALMRGIPVFCHPIATFAEYAHTSINDIDQAEPPSQEAIEEYLMRMSYLNWSDAELRDGSGFAWMMEHEA